VVAKTLMNIERALYYAMNNGRFEPIQNLRRVAGKTQLQLTVYEGLPQALRDICLKYDHGVKTIERMRLGCLELDVLKPGEVRKLRGDEIRRLLGYADEAEAGRLHYENQLLDPGRFDRSDPGMDPWTGTVDQRTPGGCRGWQPVRRASRSRGSGTSAQPSVRRTLRCCPPSTRMISPVT